MYNYVKKTKYIHINMEDLKPQTGTPAVHLEDNTSCIYAVEYKIITTGVKHIEIPVYFIQ